MEPTATIQMEPVALTIEQAAQSLTVGRDAIFALISNGSLASLRIGRRRLISSESLKAFVRAQAEAESLSAAAATA